MTASASSSGSGSSTVTRSSSHCIWRFVAIQQDRARPHGAQSGVLGGGDPDPLRALGRRSFHETVDPTGPDGAVVVDHPFVIGRRQDERRGSPAFGDGQPHSGERGGDRPAGSGAEHPRSVLDEFGHQAGIGQLHALLVDRQRLVPRAIEQERTGRGLGGVEQVARAPGRDADRGPTGGGVDEHHGALGPIDQPPGAGEHPHVPLRVAVGAGGDHEGADHERATSRPRR